MHSLYKREVDFVTHSSHVMPF